MVSYSTYSEEALASFPTLDPEDVATAAIYILSCAPHVVVSIIIHSLIIDENSKWYKKSSKKIYIYIYYYRLSHRLESTNIKYINYTCDNELHLNIFSKSILLKTKFFLNIFRTLHFRFIYLFFLLLENHILMIAHIIISYIYEINSMYYALISFLNYIFRSKILFWDLWASLGN